MPARPNLELSTGNAGGTHILVDGTAIASLGDSGTVRRDIPLDAEHLTPWKLPPASLAQALPAPASLAPASVAPASLAMTTTRSGASSVSPVVLPAAPSIAAPSAPATFATSGSTPPAAIAMAALGAVPTLPPVTHTAASPTRPAAAVPPASAVSRPRTMPSATADAMHPGDHGVLATALLPGTRAVTVGVDGITGTAGLIWPGDRLDLILTQQIPPDVRFPGS